jgi:hypothetical protein
MLIFIDTEFTGLDPGADLISIGLAAENKQTFYAELTDTYQVENVSPFVRREVLPHLEGGICRMTMAEVSRRLTVWLGDFAQPVQLATDSPVWDWPWIQRLCHRPDGWPVNLNDQPLVLEFDADKGKRFSNALEAAFKDGLRRHHALDDAIANRAAWFATLDIAGQ